MKPNCYDCQHRESIPGSAHSSCVHPATKEVHASPIAGIVAAMGKGYSGLPVIPCQAIHTLKIRAPLHAYRMGWFIWPLNFDPVWLENCEGFEPKRQPEV